MTHDRGTNHNTAVFHKNVLVIELYFFIKYVGYCLCHSDLVLSCTPVVVDVNAMIYFYMNVQCSVA